MNILIVFEISFVGKLNMFIYRPKLFKKFPYYDIFPLVLPLEFYTDGFLGINFHYGENVSLEKYSEQILPTGSQLLWIWLLVIIGLIIMFKMINRKQEIHLLDNI